MNKQEFSEKLRCVLSGIPDCDVEERLAFYGEMIDDRMEDGLSEEEAVAAVGDIGTLVSQTLEDVPLSKLVKEKMTPRRKLKAWEIVLLVLGSPLWLSFLIAAGAVIIAVYAALWAVVIALWAVFAALIACAAAGVAGGIYLAVHGHVLTGIAAVGAGLVLAGLSVFAFFGCKAATKGVLKPAGKLGVGIKRRFIKKEEA